PPTYLAFARRPRRPRQQIRRLPNRVISPHAGLVTSRPFSRPQRAAAERSPWKSRPLYCSSRFNRIARPEASQVGDLRRSNTVCSWALVNGCGMAAILLTFSRWDAVDASVGEYHLPACWGEKGEPMIAATGVEPPFTAARLGDLFRTNGCSFWHQ